MSKPNLFKYATKELSQDAFICWLLDWANKDNIEDELHVVGTNFIKAIFAKFSIESNVEINSIEIKQQYRRIDVLCLVNTTLKEVRALKESGHPPPSDSYAIIIEDKVGAGLSGDQLTRYFKHISNLGFNDNQILRVYFRTKDLLNHDSIKKAGYEIFSREDILKVLETYKGNNQILKDFKEYWGKVESDADLYKTEKYKDWFKNNNAWVGFYKTLKASKYEALNKGNNGKVSYAKNAIDTYGPLFKLEKQGYVFYVRIYGNNLKFIVQDKGSNKTDKELLETQKIWIKHITKTAFNHDWKFERPSRVSRKIVKSRELVLGDMRNILILDDGMLNMEKTMSKLNSIGNFIITKLVDELLKISG